MDPREYRDDDKLEEDLDEDDSIHDELQVPEGLLEESKG